MASWCDCEYAVRAAIRASPFDACPLCGEAVAPYKRYAETMRRFDEVVIDTRGWGGLATGLDGRLVRGGRRWRRGA